MPHPSGRTHLMAVGTALFVTVLWSSSWVLVRMGLDNESLQPLTFAGLRYGLAAVVLAGWTWRRRAHRQQLAGLDRRAVARLAGLGLLFYALTQGAQFVAIDNQPAATTGLVLALTPLMVGLSGGRVIGERATPRQLVGAAVVGAGAWLYFAGDLGATTIGMAAAVVALVANAGSSLLGRSANREQQLAPVVITSVSMTIGAVLLLVTGVLIEGWPRLTPAGLLIVCWLAVVNTAIAFTLWNRSLQHLTAVESAGINNTMLIQIAVLGWIFLDEPPGPAGVAGILVVSAGVALTQDVLARRRGPTRRAVRRR